MHGIHRRVAVVLAVSLVLVSGCEPLDNLISAVGLGEADEPDDEVVEEAPADADEPGQQAAATPEDGDEADEEAGPSESEGTEETSGEADQEAAAGTQEEPATDPQVAAPCTAADTGLDAALPPEAERVEQAAGDLTGDGQADQIITYAIGSGADSIFYLRVVTASGYVVERELDEASAMAPVAPLGAAALGGDREVTFVLESSGASGFNVALFGLHDWDDDPCALLPVTIPDHTVPRAFPVGGSVGQASGLGCDEVGGQPALLVTTAQQNAGGEHDWHQTSWRWFDAGALEFVDEDSTVVASGDTLPGVGEVACPGVAAP
jgi:hypothetical protein